MATSAYDMYFILPDANKTKLHIPVNPEEISITYDGDNKRYNVINIGEVVTPRIPKLLSIEWSSLFTAHAFQSILINPFAFYPPDYYTNILRGLQMSEDVFTFVIVRTSIDGSTITTNIQAVIESFKTTEKGGEVGDFYYTIKISEYRDYSPFAVTYKTVYGKTMASKTKQRAMPSSQIYLGCKVLVTGTLYLGPDSSVPLSGVQKMSGTVAYIMQGSLNQYQIINSTGTVQGWATKDSVTAGKDGNGH
jgi:hypothetical protein